MSFARLKRELENDIDEYDNIKKQKMEMKKDGKKKKLKPAKTKRGNFQFNDRDYSIEDDYTEDCLQNLQTYDKKISTVKADKIIEANYKNKRQDKDFIPLKTGKNKGTVFTDEDFAMLSQLNFAHSSKAVIVDDFTGDKSEVTVIKHGKRTKAKAKKKKTQELDDFLI